MAKCILTFRCVCRLQAMTSLWSNVLFCLFFFFTPLTHSEHYGVVVGVRLFIYYFIFLLLVNSFNYDQKSLSICNVMRVGRGKEKCDSFCKISNFGWKWFWFRHFWNPCKIKNTREFNDISWHFTVENSRSTFATNINNEWWKKFQLPVDCLRQVPAHQLFAPFLLFNLCWIIVGFWILALVFFIITYGYHAQRQCLKLLQFSANMY